MPPTSKNEDDRLSKENLRLKSAVEELSILNDIASARGNRAMARLRI